jgi:predicted nucleotidyltransferase
MNKYLVGSLNFLKTLEGANVEYLIIGGVAVNIHGFQRSTGDLDIWFNPTKENFQNLLTCFKKLGYDISDVEKSTKKLAETIVRLPLESFYIEMIPFLDGKSDFQIIHKRADTITVQGVSVRVINYDDLITCKANVHRAKDLEDIAQLERRKQQSKKQNPGQGTSF